MKRSLRAKEQQPPVKRIAILPTLLTLGNAVCGFAAIVWASKIDGSEASDPYFAVSGWLIIAAMLFDALDGYVARLSRTASDFGGELDSLCDAISFGLAPAFLLLHLGPRRDVDPMFHKIMVGVAAVYMVCALLRLARFNVENSPEAASHKRFRGLPSPGAAGCLASLAILRGGELIGHWPLQGLVDRGAIIALIELGGTFGALALALLMVSRISYPHITKKILRGRRHFANLVNVILVAFVIWLARDVALVALFWGYGLLFAARHAWRRLARHGVRAAAAGMDDVLPR